MNSAGYINWLMSADDPTAELARIHTTIEDFEQTVAHAQDVEYDHIWDDAQEARYDYEGSFLEE